MYYRQLGIWQFLDLSPDCRQFDSVLTLSRLVRAPRSADRENAQDDRTIDCAVDDNGNGFRPESKWRATRDHPARKQQQEKQRMWDFWMIGKRRMRCSYLEGGHFKGETKPQTDNPRPREYPLHT